MNQREKLLATVVGVLLVIVAVGYAWNSVSDQFHRRRITVDDLQNQIQRKERTVRLGRQAQRRISELEQRSLPGSPELAQRLYSHWLLDLITDIELEKPNVDFIIGRPESGGHVLSFRVSGQGTLEQITEFLYHFYSANHLQYVRRMEIRPTGNSKDLALSVDVSALVLPGPGGQQRDALNTEPSGRLASQSLSDYTGTIVSRNVFAPANLPPEVERIGRQKATLGETFSLRIKATDPDGDDLSYRLAEGAPEGARIDEQSGTLRWTPRKLDAFEVTVQVFDDGVPEKSAERTFTIEVVEAPQVVESTPSLKDDIDARFTYVTGITDGDRRLLWLEFRTTGKRVKLEEGDNFRAGKIQGEVRKIGLRDARLVLGGKTYVVSVGKNLSDGKEIPSDET